MSVVVSRSGDHVAVVEFGTPPHNFFDVEMLMALVEAYEQLTADKSCRAIVLCSSGKHFCAGANFRKSAADAPVPAKPLPHLYDVAAQLFDFEVPVIAAVQGRAIGGGFGLALSADFRIATPSTTFAANFASIGLHPGFGMSATLPRVVGQQRAMDLLYTGRSVDGNEALAMGICERVVPEDQLREEAVRMAQTLATSAPLALRSIRRTFYADIAAAVRAALPHELAEQTYLRTTEDFKAGVAAKPGSTVDFKGR